MDILLTACGPDRLDDPFDAKSLVYVGHGLCSVVHKAPLTTATPVLEEHGGVSGWVCLKQVDVDEQNAPHSVQHELVLMRRLRHANLAALLAAFTETPDAFTTVYHLAMPLYPVLLPAVLDDPAFVPQHAAPFAAVDGRGERTGNDAHALLTGHTFASFALTAMRELLDAVVYLHKEQVAHRDIKPTNVMIGTDRRVKLMDLGVAWTPDLHEQAPHAAPTSSSPGGVRAQISEVGTGAFRAPELLFAPTQGYDAFRADIWSLGVLFASFFTELVEEASGASGDRLLAEDEEGDGYTAWEQELWPRPRVVPRRAVGRTLRRKTLFDASHSDIGLAGDMFDVLGLPSEVSRWPEAAHFQPPLAQFPFVPHTSTGSVLDRLPHLSVLRDSADGPSTALCAYATHWLPRMIQLSAGMRPTAGVLREALL